MVGADGGRSQHISEAGTGTMVGLQSGRDRAGVRLEQG